MDFWESSGDPAAEIFGKGIVLTECRLATLSGLMIHPEVMFLGEFHNYLEAMDETKKQCLHCTAPSKHLPAGDGKWLEPSRNDADTR